MRIYYIDFLTSPVSAREKYQYTERAKLDLLQRLKTGVVLCTCNRTEIYITEHSAEEEVPAGLSLVEGEDAENRLFETACGLCSMLAGEDEILGQVREAYLFSFERGFCDKQLNLVFQAALACGKRSKAKTKIADVPRSVATLVAREAQAFPKERKKVLIIGSTGKMGRAVLGDVSAKKGIFVYCTRRTHGEKLEADERENVKNIDYHARYDYLKEADVVICCTSSPHTVLDFERAKEKLSGEEQWFLDISVPPDVDKKIATMPKVRLLGIDDFEKIAAKQNELYAEEIEKVRAVCQSGFETFLKEKYLRETLPFLSEEERERVKKLPVRQFSVEEYKKRIGRKP